MSKQNNSEDRKEREYALMEQELQRLRFPVRFRAFTVNRAVLCGCIHCGRPANLAASTGGEYGICAECIED